MSEKLKDREWELSCLLNSLSHLKESVKFLNLSYSSAIEPRKAPNEFSDVTYALGVLQSHSGTIDTLIERRIAWLRRKIRKAKRKAKLAERDETTEDK